MTGLIDDALSENGFLLVSPATADFMVAYYVARLSRQTVKGYRDFELLGARWRLSK